MQTMTLQAEIAPDDKLHLDVPTYLPAGTAEVVVTIQPLASPTPGLSAPCREPIATPVALAEPPRSPGESRQPNGAPAPPTKTCSGLFLNRLPHDYDIDAALDDMSTRWKAKLLELEL